MAKAKAGSSVDAVLNAVDALENKIKDFTKGLRKVK